MSSVKVEHGAQMYQLTEPGMEWVHMKSHWVLMIAGHGASGESEAGPRVSCPPSPLGNGQEQKLRVLKPFFPRQAGQGAGMVVLATVSSWDMLHGHHVAVSPASHLPFPGTEHRSLLKRRINWTRIWRQDHMSFSIIPPPPSSLPVPGSFPSAHHLTKTPCFGELE